MAQQDTEQLKKRLAEDELANRSAVLEPNLGPAAVGDETTLLDVPDGAPLTEDDFDGLDQLPELEEDLPQSLEEVFEGEADQTRLMSRDQQSADSDALMTSDLATEGLDRTLAFQDDRKQPATDTGADRQADVSGPDGTARIASIDDTQLRPYAIDPYENERVEAADAIDSGDYELPEERYARPASRLRQIVVIVIAGLLVALVAYALTSIVLHGGLRMPTSSPTATSQASDAKKDTTAQEEPATQEEWQNEQPVEQQEQQTMDEGSNAPEATSAEETDTTAAEVDTPAPADDAVDATEVEPTEVAEPTDAGEADVTPVEEAAPIEEEQVADAAVETSEAEVSDAEVTE